MPKQPTRHEEESYRVPFFIIASLFMASVLWLVYQEFFTRRPWKDVQLTWFQVERARAEKNLAGEKKWLADGTVKVKDEGGAESEVKVADRIAALDKSIKELEGNIIDTPKRVEFERLKRELEKQEIAVKDQEMRVAFGKADEDAIFYIYRHAKHAGHTEEEKHQKELLDAQHDKVAQMAKVYDQEVAKRDAITDKLDAIQRALTASKKELDELRAGVVVAQRAVDSTDTRFTGIEQYWNQSIALVDRCQTCHVAAEKCGYSAPQEILEEIIAKKIDQEQVRKAFCITREEAAAYCAAAEEISDSFGSEKEKTFEDVKAKLGLDKDPVVTVAQKAKMSIEDADQVFRSHPNRMALLGKHPGGIFGCTTCHYGEGRATKAIGLNYLAGDMASKFDHARKDEYWELQQLETKPYQVEGLTGVTGQPTVEASCYNCHKNDYELEGAPRLTQARKLVQHLGCTGCHPLGPTMDAERKFGPTLTKVAGKIDPAWMLSWIKYPKAMRPRTRMPNFWPEAVKDGKPDPTAMNCNSFDYTTGNPPTPAVWENCLEKREREAAYLTAFLNKASEEVSYPAMPSSADAAHGKELVDSIGCKGCHNIGDWTKASHMPGSDDRDLAPNLSDVGDKVKTPGWFFAWVSNPKSYWHETRMPRLRLSEAEAWDVAAYLASQKGKGTPKIDPKTQAFMDEPEAAEKGKKLLNWYGCFGCHDVKGFEKSTRIGIELTDFGLKLPAKLDFGDVPHFASNPHNETWDAWTRTKVQTPRVFRYERVETRMPQFDLTPPEVESVILFLRSQNSVATNYPAQIKYQQSEEVAAIQRGNFLIDAYNCRGCHLIDGRGTDVDGDHKADGGDIYRLYADNQDEKFRTPPKLMQEGRKVYPDWLYKFLKEPFKLRENYKLRMPTFQFSDAQAADLVAHFAAKAGSPYPYVEKKRDQLSHEDLVASGQLFEAAQCLKCHNLDGVSKDPRNVAPNLRLAADRLQYPWLFDWLKDPQAIAPGVGMPGFFVPDDAHPGEYTTPLPTYAGGDWRKQIELLRAYVISLGAGDEKLATAPAPEKKKGRGR